MSSKELEVTTVEYPTTSLFETLVEELVDWSEKVLKIADQRKTYPRNDDRYYDAMADLDVIITILPVLGRSLRKEMDHLSDLFPDEADDDDDDDDE